MNSIFTSVSTVKISRSSLRRAFVLSVIIVFLPGCINKAGICDTLLSTTITAIHGVAIKGSSPIADTILIRNNEIIVDAGSENDEGDGASNIISLPGLLPSIDADHHFDPHGNEKGHVINMAFPRLMRIAIMLLLAVLII